MSLKNKKVLILGAAGFIGKHLVDHLIDHTGSLQLAGYGVEEMFGGIPVSKLEGKIDEGLLGICAEPDIIFHLIGGASVGASIADPRHDFELTIPPLFDVIDKLKADWKNAKLIFVSSAAVYGHAASDATSVNTALDPASPYGLHKKMAEELIQFYASQYGFDYSIIRPFSVYGPGLRKQLLWDALHKVAADDITFFGTGQEMRDWIYVNDLVVFLAFIAGATAELPRILNAGTGISISVNGILSKLFEQAGYQCRPKFKDLNKQGDPNSLVSYLSEQNEIRIFFNTPLEVGLNNYINWYRQVRE